jgi:hypothetical protein
MNFCYMTLVQELSAHGVITATHVNDPAKGHCTNHYRFLWHPWMQTTEDGDFRMMVREEQAPFPTAESELSIAPHSEPMVNWMSLALVNHRSLPSDPQFTQRE